VPFGLIGSMRSPSGLRGRSPLAEWHQLREKPAAARAPREHPQKRLTQGPRDILSEEERIGLVARVPLWISGRGRRGARRYASSSLPFFRFLLFLFFS
jgi:hypothetical protein